MINNDETQHQTQKLKTSLSLKQKRKHDALELAELIYEMFTRPDKIEVEQKD